MYILNPVINILISSDKPKEMPKKTNVRHDDAYRNQKNMVRKLRYRIQQMERTHAKLLNTVGFGLYERSRKDVRIKRLFRSIDALLSGDDNGEDQPAFLIDQVCFIHSIKCVSCHNISVYVDIEL